MAATAPRPSKQAMAHAMAQATAQATAQAMAAGAALSGAAGILAPRTLAAAYAIGSMEA